ncbi:MAG: hypothetical protein KDC10_13020 [Calditrichaeota bacterium]|nr:hypothetical protein [Calditrichota bacterium]
MKALPLLFLALTLAAPARAWQPGDHELLTMPTAWTMDQGSSYFTDYELFFLNYSYGVTPRTHVGVFTMFPIVSEFINTVSLGVKQNWLDGEKVDGALWGTYTPDGGMFTLGNVFSIGEPSKSLHVGACAVMGLNDSNNHTEWVGMVGYRGDLSEKGSLLFEYYNSSSMLDDGFNGMVNLGYRFRLQTVSVDFGGIRPLADTGDLLFVPYLKATLYFGGNP